MAAADPRWPHRSRRPSMPSISGSITGSHPSSEERPRLRLLSSIDGGLILSALLLAAIGLATVHSASSEMPVDYFPRQAGWVAVGLVLMVISMSIDYHVLLDLSVVLYVLGLASLVGVLLFGVAHGGAANWMKIGGFQFQPSEFAKIATCLFLARYLAGLNLKVLELRHILIGASIVLLP